MSDALKDDGSTILKRQPCFLAVDKRGKVRGRYRFAHLAILEASEKGWELRMADDQTSAAPLFGLISPNK